MEPLRVLLKKNNNFIWNENVEEVFLKLKKSISHNNLLIHLDHNKEFIVETDASDFALGCVLSQKLNEDNLLHPVAFYSRSMTSTEINYAIYDKELLGVITALEVWKHHLEGSILPFQIITNHKKFYISKNRNI